jgi:hypothetical protein
MSRLTGDDLGVVVPLRRRREPHWEQADATVPDVEEALRSFDLLERYALRLESGFPRSSGPDDFPIVDYLVQLPVARRQLESLRRLSTLNCPDTGWVFRLAGARAEAAERVRAVDGSLLRDPPGTGPLGERLAGDIRRLAGALREVRRLLVQRNPDTAASAR